MPVRKVKLNHNDTVIVKETNYPIGYISHHSGEYNVYRYDLYNNTTKLRTFSSVHDARYFALQYFSTHQ